MPNLLRGFLVWTLTIFMLSAASYAVVSTYEPHSETIATVHDDRAPHHEIQVKDEKGFREALLTDPVAFFTMVLAIFTMGLAAVTIALWQEARRASAEQAAFTRESLRHAEASAKAAAHASEAASRQTEYATASGRAHIRIDDLSIVIDQSIFDNIFSPGVEYVGGDIRYAFRLKNLGNSPADIFSVGVGAICGISPNEATPRVIEAKQRTIGPGETSINYSGTWILSFELFKHAELIRQQRHIFIVIDIIYYDVFGELQNETTYWRYGRNRGEARRPIVALIDRRKLVDRQS